MKKNINIKIIFAFFVIFLITSCGWLKDKVEKKIDEKVNQTIDENLRKIDSNMSRQKLDSLKSKLDSLMNDSTAIRKGKKKSK